jgi:hypothetical protein
MAAVGPTARRRGVLRVVALLLSATAAVAGAGCTTLSVAPGEQARTTAGEVRMDGRSRGCLVVAEHRFRRDERGHLAAFVEFRNVAGRPYTAMVRVMFADRYGRLEKRAYATQEHCFSSGSDPIEWTSDTPDAETYVIEVWAPPFLFW